MDSNIPPLRSIPLTSRPCNPCALSWSRDAELAVAADDSVTIYVPQFPFLDPDKPLQFGDSNADVEGPTSAPENVIDVLPNTLIRFEPIGGNDDASESESDSDDDDDGDSDGGKADEAKKQTTQFSEDTARKLWISYPPLHPELNMHVWEAAGKAMPLIRSAAVVEATVDTDAKVVDAPVDVEVEVEAEQVIPDEDTQDQPKSPEAEREEGDEVEEEEEEEVIEYAGAGTGAIGGSGSSLNHVVAIEWSPGRVGRNQRPVLAVLTGCGSLAVYGEGGSLPFGTMAKSSRTLGRGKGAVRNLQSWLALWAVGGKFVLPGQEEIGYGECIKSFAWSKEMGGGQALLAYMNDLKEIVVLCVGTTFQLTAAGLDEAIWNVQEVVRIESRGPHVQVPTSNPTYIPSDSSYCLRWSPWIKGEKTWSCFLSYMHKSWVGFKKITVNAPTWNPREIPSLACVYDDWYGLCVHLAADAFLTFEETICTINQKRWCRGIIATPLVAKDFAIPVDDQAGNIRPHFASECNTTYPSEASYNPITGLVVHTVPFEATGPPLTPLYTAVRLSATATNLQWWESNAFARTPQWVTEINNQITRSMSFSKAIYAGEPSAETAEDGDDGILHLAPEGGTADRPVAAEAISDDDNDDDEQEEVDLDANFDPWANAGPEVYPYSMRLWGLAVSPGGGSSAVLATPLLTQRPMRGGWTTVRSCVMFGQEDLAPTPQEDEEGDIEMENDSNHRVVNLMGLSTEARMWEWMYGGGLYIPGLTPEYPPESSTTLQGEAQRSRDLDLGVVRAAVLKLFEPFIAAQKCELCGSGKFTPILDVFEQDKQQRDEAQPHQLRQGQEQGGRFLDAACPQGHRVAVCGATGLAIQVPGISRACGVCQSRCMNWEYVVNRVLDGHETEQDYVKEHMPRDVCARCGGKYLD